MRIGIYSTNHRVAVMVAVIAAVTAAGHTPVQRNDRHFTAPDCVESFDAVVVDLESHYSTTVADAYDEREVPVLYVDRGKDDANDALPSELAAFLSRSVEPAAPVAPVVTE